MKLTVISLFLLFPMISSIQKDETAESVRILIHNQKEIKTTYEVDDKFFGKYQGRKNGYLVLNSDGSGAYRYDYQAFLPEGCEAGEIPFEWGFIVDESGKPVKFEREYGYSYPIIYSCTGRNSFQGCTKTSMVDYLLVYKDGTITVSSSDDWEKK